MDDKDLIKEAIEEYYRRQKEEAEDFLKTIGKKNILEKKIFEDVNGKLVQGKVGPVTRHRMGEVIKLLDEITGQISRMIGHVRNLTKDTFGMDDDLLRSAWHSLGYDQHQALRILRNEEKGEKQVRDIIADEIITLEEIFKKRKDLYIEMERQYSQKDYKGLQESYDQEKRALSELRYQLGLHGTEFNRDLSRMSRFVNTPLGRVIVAESSMGMILLGVLMEIWSKNDPQDMRTGLGALALGLVTMISMTRGSDGNVRLSRWIRRLVKD